MTRWARLTWQVPDADEFADDLAARLGLATRPGGLVAGASTIDLGSALLEVRPWVRESAADDPRPAGRLVLEPVPDGEPAPEDVLPGAPRPLRLAAIGWATVELDRAEAELDPWLGPRPATTEPAAPSAGCLDLHLGARARVRAGGGLPGDALVLLEPSTEGRLAASLARDGEGPCAIYLAAAGGLAAWLAAARTRGVTVSPRHDGPVGRSVIVLGGPAAGPHVLLVEPPSHRDAGAVAGTIAP